MRQTKQDKNKIDAKKEGQTLEGLIEITNILTHSKK